MADIILDFPEGVVKFPLAETLAETMKDATLEVINETAETMKFIAKTIVRVDTGTLQKTIRKERKGNIINVRAGGFYANPKTGKICDYALIVELKYPYMKPAWIMASAGIEERIRERAIERVRRKFGG